MRKTFVGVRKHSGGIAKIKNMLVKVAIPHIRKQSYAIRIGGKALVVIMA